MKVLGVRFRKYFEQYVLSLKRFHEYKLHFYTSLFKPFVQILVLSLIWFGIFQITGKETIAGMTVSVFIVYIILVSFIKIAVHPWTISRDIVALIKEGDFLSVITRPVDYLFLQFAKSFAEISMRGLYSIFLLFILILGFNIFGKVNPLFDFVLYFPTNWYTIPLTIISIFFGLVISYLFYFVISCLSFWTGEVWSVMQGVVNVQEFLSGAIIPLSISSMLLSVSNLFPFKFMIFTPTYIFVEGYTLAESLFAMLGQVVWILIMYFIARLVLKKGIARFEAQGG